MATKRELCLEIQRYRQAQALLQLGVRVPVACEMTRLSHWFLRKLALEICGEAPSKGQMPNSELWYLRGRNNLHSSLFLSIYQPLRALAPADTDASDLLITAYQRYQEIIAVAGLPEILTPDRAWWLLKSLRIPSLKRVHCQRCGGAYLMHQGDLAGNFRCAVCLNRLERPPEPNAAAPGRSLAGPAAASLGRSLQALMPQSCANRVPLGDQAAEVPGRHVPITATRVPGKPLRATRIGGVPLAGTSLAGHRVEA